ncbi:MAG: arginyltransferase [Nitrospirae bacterium]|nr:arginyltransferase [Nitrospirota bacterium]
MNSPRPNLLSIPLALSSERPCPYLPGRVSSDIFIAQRINMKTCWSLFASGFRRSGPVFYRPHCPGCGECVPVRVPVDDFRPSRSQKRAFAKNADMTVTVSNARFDEEHYRLFQKYQNARHPNGSMRRMSREDYVDMFDCNGIPTFFYESRVGGALACVAVTDVLPDALSAVYTFYDPDRLPGSPGVFAVLHQIREAKRLGLKYLYLGFWIKNSETMAYKSAFRPFEALVEGVWRQMEP